MRITLLNQFYLPDSVPTAQLAGSFAESLVANGHEITVICGRGAYAGGIVGAAALPGSDHGVRVVRLWTPALGKTRLISRAADYLAFYAQAAIAMFAAPPQDAIVAMTTPPFIALAAWLHKFRHRRPRLILWNMDSYPEIAIASGYLRPHSLVSRLLRTVNRFLFRQLDLVAVLDQAMAENLAGSYAVSPSRPQMVVVPNWERAAAFPPAHAFLPTPPAGLEGRFIVIYLGNAGSGHQFDAVLDAAEQLRSEPVTFLFVGGGSRFAEIEQACRTRGLANVILRGYIPKDQTGPLMAGCHAALITLKDSAGGLVSPSKLHAYLALSLPVIYVGPERSNVDAAIKTHGVGFSLRSGDANGVVAAVRSLRADGAGASRIREQSRQAFDAAYCDTQAVPQLERAIEAAVEHNVKSTR